MAEAGPHRTVTVRFADYDLDLRSGELHKAGLRLRLPDQPLQLLILLIEHRGELVTREQVRARLWPGGRHVDYDRATATALKRVREALGDSPDAPRFIETVPRKGYRFVAPVEELAALPALAQAAEGQGPRIAAPAGRERARAERAEWPGGTPLPEDVGRYELIERLGTGGQGEVFRARDLRLEREVAIKFLPDWMAQDPVALHRFRREAHAAASLSHPNVIAVYDMALMNGAPCLVSELLDGRTLRSALLPGAMPINEAIPVALHMLAGLTAAHDKGIVHRDLKPENVFLTSDGRVKILDFGLAKQCAGAHDAALETTTMSPTTRVGAVLGTLGYQSPEQARGEEVDPRSDLFAFGAVLYEMLTGRHPFRRPTEADTIAAVLNASPAPPSSLVPSVPVSCDAITAKALEKDREFRYQSASELRIDLLRVLRELTGRSASDFDVEPTLPAAGPTRLQRLGRYAMVGIPAAVLIAALVFALSLRNAIPWFDPQQLTYGNGGESQPALSPDGTLVAYTSDEAGNADIWLFDRRNRTSSRFTSDPAADRHADWLSDGSEVLFVSERSGVPSIWKAPVLGGAARLLIGNAEDPAVSPDGQTVAFARNVSGHYRIFVAPLANPTEQRQITTAADGLWSHRQPAWSPDSASICYAAHQELWVVSATGRDARLVLGDNEYHDNPTWSQDGSQVYFSSSRGGSQTLWRVRIDRPFLARLIFWRPQAAERVTRGAGPELDPMVSRDGRSLVYSTMQQDSNLLLHDLATGTDVSWGTAQFESFPALAPNGKRVFYVSRADPPYSQLWSLDLQNGRPDGKGLRLTQHAGYVSHPACSRDGRWVAYYLIEKDNRRAIWIVRAAGGVPIRITEGPKDTLPAWAPDGSRLAFVREGADGKNRLWSVPVSEGRATGTPAPIIARPPAGTDDDAPAWSPDGGLIAYGREPSGGGGYEVWTVRPDGTGETRLTKGAGAVRMAWDETAPGSLFVAGTWGGGELALRRITLAPFQAPQPLAQPVRMDEDFADFSVSQDGRLLVLSRYVQKGNIWVLAARGNGRF